MEFNCAIKCFFPAATTTFYATLRPAGYLDFDSDCPLAPALHEADLPEPRGQDVTAIQVPSGSVLAVYRDLVGGVAQVPESCTPGFADAHARLWTWRQVPEARSLTDPTVLCQSSFIVEADKKEERRRKSQKSKKPEKKGDKKKRDEDEDDKMSYYCNCMQVPSLPHLLDGILLLNSLALDQGPLDSSK